MRRLLAVLGLLALFIVASLSGSVAGGKIGALEAQPAQAAATSDCFGASVDTGYVQKFGTLRGTTTPSTLEYPEGRWYREAQSWATEPAEDPGHPSEHMHIATCFPNGQTMTGTFDLDIVVTFHNFKDYKVLQAGQNTVTPSGSRILWRASPEVVAQLQAAADASGEGGPHGSVQKVYFSVRTELPMRNGFKEVREAIKTQEVGPDSEAIFVTWQFDPRWYFTDAIAGLPDALQAVNQMAIRNRSQVTHRNLDGTVTGPLYHHGGLCGMDGIDHLSTIYPTDCASKKWTDVDVSKPWSTTEDKRITLYFTDGGGDTFLMINPELHGHYDAPTTACPNVDANGNCLGKWFWQGVTCCSQQFPVVTIPASVLASLDASKVHRLVLLSSDEADCERLDTACPAGVRGEWSNVEVLPFLVDNRDTEAPSVPTGFVKSNPGTSAIDVAWEASTDDTGVAGYRVYRGMTLIADQIGTSARVVGLSDPNYTVWVEAYDAAGNVSARGSVPITRTWK
jgi:hypothetical protein